MMTGKVELKPVTSLWPIHRKQLLNDVLTGNRLGEVHKIWITRGHVFVSVEQGTKLFTFDVKPVGIGQDYQFGNLGCLDVTELQPALTDVLFSQKLSSVILVQLDGHVQLWKFSQQNYKWQRLTEDYLCLDENSEITSVCLIERQLTLYWCEKPHLMANKNQSIWRRDIQNGHVFGPPVKVLDNIPSCGLFPLKTGIFVSVRLPIPITGLVLQPLTNKVSLYSGASVHMYTPSDTHKCLDFKDIVIPHLPNQKLSPGEDNTIVELFRRDRVIVIQADGSMRSLSDKPGIQKVKVQIDTDDFKEESCRYFFRRDCIGQVTHNSVILHNYRTGERTQPEPVDNQITGVHISDVSPVPSFSTVITNSGLKAVQLTTRQPLSNLRPEMENYAKELNQPRLNVSSKAEMAEIVCKSFLQGSFPAREYAVDGKRFQSPALVITMLDQLEEKVNSPCMNKERKSVLQSYNEKNLYQHTRYNESIGPYLDEYMKIEKASTDIFNQNQKILVTNLDSVEKETLALIDPSSLLPMSVRQTQLDRLALRHPETVLVTLMQQLEIDSKELSEEETEKWNSVLVSENNVSLGYTGASLPLYETICRLMFQQKPDQLVNFVHIAQMIHDKTVGVSAFIRKKQTFYERALSCFPRLESSRDLHSAVKAVAELMLAMQTRTNLVKAVQLLVQYSQWDEAVEVLKEHSDNSAAHQEIFYILLTSVASCGVLSTYCVPVLEHIPESVSLISVLEMIGSQGNCSQPITSPVDVFCRGSADIAIGQVQSIFLSLLNKKK